MGAEDMTSSAAAAAAAAPQAVPEGMLEVATKAAQLRKTLVKSKECNTELISILGSFGERLSSLETAMRPVQTVVHQEKITHDIIDKALTTATTLFSELNVPKEEPPGAVWVSLHVTVGTLGFPVLTRRKLEVSEMFDLLPELAQDILTRGVNREPPPGIATEAREGGDDLCSYYERERAHSGRELGGQAEGGGGGEGFDAAPSEVGSRSRGSVWGTGGWGAGDGGEEYEEEEEEEEWEGAETEFGSDSSGFLQQSYSLGARNRATAAYHPALADVAPTHPRTGSAGGGEGIAHTHTQPLRSPRQRAPSSYGLNVARPPPSGAASPARTPHRSTSKSPHHPRSGAPRGGAPKSPSSMYASSSFVSLSTTTLDRQKTTHHPSPSPSDKAVARARHAHSKSMPHHLAAFDFASAFEGGGGGRGDDDDGNEDDAGGAAAFRTSASVKLPRKLTRSGSGGGNAGDIAAQFELNGDSRIAAAAAAALAANAAREGAGAAPAAAAGAGSNAGAGTAAGAGALGVGADGAGGEVGPSPRGVGGRLDTGRKLSRSFALKRRNSVLMLAADDVKVLNKIAERMCALKDSQQCTRIYITIRAWALDMSMKTLGVEPISEEQLANMPWEVVKVRVTEWIQHMRVALVDQVLQGLDPHRERCFAELAHGSMSLLLGFADKIARSPTSAEKAFVLLDIYECLRDLLPQVSVIFAGSACILVREEGANLMRQMTQATRATLAQFEDGIESDKTAEPPDANVHPLTSYVMNYIKFLSEFDESKQLVGAEWVQRRKRLLQHHASTYQRAASGPILECLKPLENQMTGDNLNRSAVKILKERVALGDKTKHKKHHIKYSPEDVQQMLSHLFEGKPLPAEFDVSIAPLKSHHHFGSSHR
eukprot:jgi/Mesen1/10130/ME000075S09640